MNLDKDKLVMCPCCKSDACYESEVNATTITWLCWTCGFTSNSKMVDGSSLVEHNEKNTAELIKDLKQLHNNTSPSKTVALPKLAWFPTVLNIRDKGMVFPEGKSTKDWHWKAVKAIPVPKEDQSKFPIPGQPGKFYEYQMDMKNQKEFGRFSFMDAAEEIGLFNIEE